MEKKFPSEIILEVTNRCNLACVMCHFHGKGAPRKRELGDMTPRLWQKILDEIEREGKPVFLLTHGAGEPLIYDPLMDLLQRAKQIPHIRLGFMTNAMALTPEVSSRLLDIGLDSIAFSVDGVEAEPHSRYRKGSDLPLIEQHIQTLIRLKGERNKTHPEIIFNMVGLPELMNQVQAYVDRWIPHSTQVMISRYRPMGSRRFPGYLVPDNRRPCPNPDYQMVVSWDGRVALCCEDIHCHVELGNLNDQNISQVFNGEAVNTVRKAHLQHQWKDVPFCMACDTWCAGDVIRETRDEKGIICRETPAQWVYIPG